MSSTDQAKLTGDEYMQLLLQRQSEWLAANPPNTRGRLTSLPPLLEWFIRDGDEDLVELPQPLPNPHRSRAPTAAPNPFAPTATNSPPGVTASSSAATTTRPPATSIHLPGGNSSTATSPRSPR